MKNFKGTSGKWKVITTSETEHQTLFITSEQHGAICQIPHRFKALQEHEANAKLIASAPEMLAALVEINRWLYVNYPEHGQEHEFGTCATFNKIRGAIKKATE